MICLLGIIIVIIGVIIDQVTKYFASSYIKDNPIIIIEDILELRYLENRGAAFGMLQNQQWFFLIITVITLCIITYIYFYSSPECSRKDNTEHKKKLVVIKYFFKYS